MRLGLNCGSGQRPFTSTEEMCWANIDIQEKWKPDIVADWNNLGMFPDEEVDIVVSHHSIEHVGCGEADGFIRESCRVLKPGSSLLVFVPDLRALAQRWLMHQLTTQIYMTNIYGPFDGNEASRHRWGYVYDSLKETLMNAASWSKVVPFDWRSIPGGDFARDFWVLAVEAVK